MMTYKYHRQKIQFLVKSFKKYEKTENTRNRMAFHSKILKTRETTWHFTPNFLFLVTNFKKVCKSLTKFKIKSRIHNALHNKKSYKGDIYKYHLQIIGLKINLQCHARNQYCLLDILRHQYNQMGVRMSYIIISHCQKSSKRHYNVFYVSVSKTLHHVNNS